MIRKVFSASALVLLATSGAHASCFSSGSSRICDGNGGYGATYTPVSTPSITDIIRDGSTRSTIIRTQLDNNSMLIEKIKYAR